MVLQIVCLELHRPTSRDMCFGAHEACRFQSSAEGWAPWILQVGADGTRSGWLSDSGAELATLAGGAVPDWRVACCAAGDIVVLGGWML